VEVKDRFRYGDKQKKDRNIQRKKDGKRER
jgi:hypothetical protein